MFLAASYFPKCYRDDSNLDACLLKASETVQPFLKKGVPELNIPQISPLLIPELAISEGSASFIFKSVFKNMLVYGLENYTFSKLR